MARGSRRYGRSYARRLQAGSAGGSPDAQPAAGATTERPRAGPRADRGPVQRDVSSGGVVFRRDSQGVPSVALVGRLRPKRWALPKGTPMLGETLEQTALREVAEETGLQARIVQPLDEIQYWFVWGGVRHFKTVHFYLMEMTGGDIADHDAEYDLVEWFSMGEALRALSYPNETRVVEKAQSVLLAEAGHATGNGTSPAPAAS